MSRVAIIGVGLMGGSLGLALARRRRWRVTGVGRSPEKLRRAKRLGCVRDYTTDFREGVREADAVVLCVPVADIVPWGRKVRPYIKPGTLVMDVGSVKSAVVGPLDRLYAAGQTGFIGVHPMAGSEKTGVEHARADLYEGATCVVAPGPRAPEAAVRRAEAFWRAAGGRVLRMDPDEHDRWMAMISHLPHALAECLATAAGRWGGAEKVRALAAGSFRDMTRVAGADPEQWAAIFRLNGRHLRTAARVFEAAFRKVVRGTWSPADVRRARRLHDSYNLKSSHLHGDF